MKIVRGMKSDRATEFNPSWRISLWYKIALASASMSTTAFLSKNMCTALNSSKILGRKLKFAKMEKLRLRDWCRIQGTLVEYYLAYRCGTELRKMMMVTPCFTTQ
ncbi:hypothetical protein K1719_036269 [Acacia pycnantha]|nr:hypothetical protein K1719_036269 [Acacia pycnantha]